MGVDNRTRTDASGCTRRTPIPGSPRRPRLLTVGPYERDNFGDLLFLVVTERYLPDFEVVAGAPFASDMTALLDREVVAYGDYLDEHDVDAIWSVGGQTGAVTVRSAYRMSKTAEQWRALLQAPPEERRGIVRRALNGAPLHSAYIPTPGAFPRNAGAVTVVNSSGLAGVAGLPPHIKEEVVGTLRTTDVVSVRDLRSSQVMDQLGVEHRLVPDVVHALSALWPAEPDHDSPSAVVQISDSLLKQYGEDALVEQLATAPSLADLRLDFVAAGVANGHDSIETLQRLADRVRELSPGRETVVHTRRRPLDIVETVREARVVISTSLHMRIVAASYHVPRVTLERNKPAAYARHWDPLMPYNVPVAELDEAVAAARRDARLPEVRESSERLVRLADDNAREIAEQVRALVAADPAERERIGAERRSTYEALERRRADEEQHVLALEKSLRRARRELAEARAQLAQPPAWRRTAGRVRQRVQGAVRARRPGGGQ